MGPEAQTQIMVLNATNEPIHLMASRNAGKSAAFSQRSTKPRVEEFIRSSCQQPRHVELCTIVSTTNPQRSNRRTARS